MPVRLIILFFAALLAQSCITLPPIGPTNDRGRLSMEVVQPGKNFFTIDQILILPLSGLVTSGDQTTGFHGEAGMLVQLKDRLDIARKNKRLKAIILRIDSPGGTVTASDVIHRELVKFKHETGLPLIALMGDVAASGGFYVAMAADEVYALPTSITGSIGVISMFPNFTGLSEKLGVNMNIVKSGRMKDAGSPWRAMKAEEKEHFQHLVDQYHARFTHIILESRESKGLTKADLEKVADGRVLTGLQARDAKLIDGIMYMDEAIERAKELAGIPDAEVVSYEYPYHYRGNIYAQAQGGTPMASGGSGPQTINLFSFGDGEMMRNLAGAHFLYLWLP